MKPANVRHIFATFRQTDPAPKTELVALNPFTLLVSIVLSAQATDVSVNKATPPLFAIADTPQKMSTLSEAKIKSFIKTIGLFNAKARNVLALSKMLVEEYDGKIPEDRDELQKLPGVGRKTANVWLNCVLGEPTIAVDTHVFRVSNRLGLVKAENPLECELQLEKVVPKEFRHHAHHWLILHGRYICVARAPKCAVCPVYQWCEYKAKTA